MNTHHPVLINDVLQVLAPKLGECYLDATAGYGGHAAAVLQAVGASGGAVLIDRDAAAIRSLSNRFDDTAQVIHGSYLSAAENLAADGFLADMILLDLGVSSPQIDTAQRGFSFRAEAPLDMRMDQSQDLTAADVVNTYREGQLAYILREFGEEPKANAVARAIVAARPFKTTTQLASVIRKSAVATSDIDSATRSFQGIRIEVNGELRQLEKALPVMSRILRPGGRLAVISFHSLEDRIVKTFFNTESRDCICPPKQPICTCHHLASLRKLTGKPITADSSEIAFNPRARSAKLRAAEKQNQK